MVNLELFSPRTSSRPRLVFLSWQVHFGYIRTFPSQIPNQISHSFSLIIHLLILKFQTQAKVQIGKILETPSSYYQPFQKFISLPSTQEMFSLRIISRSLKFSINLSLFAMELFFNLASNFKFSKTPYTSHKMQLEAHYPPHPYCPLIPPQ